MSPDTEAIWEAYEHELRYISVFQCHDLALAAAIRAVADQVVPQVIARADRKSQLRSDRSKFRMTIRAEILAIADELEGRE